MDHSNGSKQTLKKYSIFVTEGQKLRQDISSLALLDFNSLALLDSETCWTTLISHQYNSRI